MRYKHLTQEERMMIGCLKASQKSAKEIAGKLKRSSSTIIRELARNSAKDGYDHTQAQEVAKMRRVGSYKSRGKLKGKTLRYVLAGLKKAWSPEQISGRMKREGLESVSHECIYQMVWKDKRDGGSLYKGLRHRGKYYCRRKNKKSRRGMIPNRVDIDKRPPEVELKNRIGDWELDTVIGKGQKEAIVTLVDRYSKLTRLLRVSDRTAKTVTEAVIKLLKSPRYPVLTLTADNGKEFTNHETISKALKAKFYFSKPYHSWERGLNEHTNGLLRQFAPKSCNFSSLSDQQVNFFEFLLNNRPRRVLNFKTPHEVFSQALTSPVSCTSYLNGPNKSVSSNSFQNTFNNETYQCMH